MIKYSILRFLLQESLRKQGLKLKVLVSPRFSIRSCKRVYENKDWNAGQYVCVCINLNRLVARESTKTRIETHWCWFPSLPTTHKLQESLRKQGLKQSETPFGVSDTFPAYKKYWYSLRSKNKVLLVKLFFWRKGLLQESLRKQGLKLEFLQRFLRFFLAQVARESTKTRIETSGRSSSCGVGSPLQESLRKQGLKPLYFLTYLNDVSLLLQESLRKQGLKLFTLRRAPPSLSPVLQESLRKQGLKLIDVDFLHSPQLASCKRVYENKDWNPIGAIFVNRAQIAKLQESLRKQGLKLYHLRGHDRKRYQLQESLWKQGLKRKMWAPAVRAPLVARESTKTRIETSILMRFLWYVI